MIKIVSIILLFLYPTSHIPHEKNIRITSQNDFDHIQETIERELKSDSNIINVVFEQGTFFFDDCHIMLCDMEYPDKELHFIGNNTIISSKGKEYKNREHVSETFDSGTGIISKDRDVFVWGKVFQANSPVQVFDKESGIYRIKCDELKTGTVPDIKNCYVTLSEWYRSDTLKVFKITDNYLYFKAKSPDGLNSDFAYAFKFPRFKLSYTIESPVRFVNGTVFIDKKIESIHICKNGRLLSSNKAKFKGISFKGFRFIGNRDNVFAFMDFTDVRANNIIISDCEFCGLRSKIIQVAFTPNFTFTNNYIHDCYRSGVTSFASTKTTVSNNIFNNVGLSMSNDFSISCGGEDYEISNNKISDFGYGAIAIGIHYREKKVCKLNGLVKENEIYYSKPYFVNYKEHTLMDSGAIYVYTQNDEAIITRNDIHDYIGIKDNRGIFLDDGAFNVLIEKNSIKRIANSWCIDSRLVKSVEKEIGSQVKKVNFGNVIRDNDIDGKIRFEQ